MMRSKININNGGFKSPPFILYTIATTGILCWWYFAFVFSTLNPPQERILASKKNEHVNLPPYLSYLSPLNREKIQQALAGDVKLMTTLMADWDVDARILEKHGLHTAKKLSRSDFLKAQMIGRELTGDIPHQRSNQTVTDDNGIEFPLNHTYQKFLPQTYISASFLLALTEPENIVAIPQGFRYQNDLYPRSLTDKIPLDIDRYNSERIYHSQPDIAFVAHYSHPSTLQSLTNQGIPLFTLKSINNMPEIYHAIERIGHVVDKPLKAELLTLFMESAMLAIDNHLLAMSHTISESHELPRTLFLYYMNQFSTPSKKNITGQLLSRLQLLDDSLFPHTLNQWTLPVDHEQIVNLNPECLIIATSHSELVKNQILATPAFHAIEATKNNAVFFVDTTPQAPSQYIVLAYYDIVDALVKTVNPLAR